MTPLHNSRWCYSCCSLYEWDSWNCIVLGCLLVLFIRLSTLQMKRQRKVKYLAQVYPLCKWQSQDLHLGYLASSRVWTHNYCTLLKNINFWFKKKSHVSYGHLRWLFLGHCFSRSGPWTRNISIIWELVRNVNYNAPPPSQIYWIRNSGMGPSNLCFNKPPADSDARSNLRTTVLGNNLVFLKGKSILNFFLFILEQVLFQVTYSN